MAIGTIRVVLLLLTIIAAGLQAALATAAPVASAPPFQLGARPGGEGLELIWTIAPGEYLYRDKIAVKTPGSAVITAELPPGETKDDPTFGPTEVYYKNVTAKIPAAALNGTAKLSVSYQGCSSRGICYPPMTAEVDLTTYQVSPAGRAVGSGAASSPSLEWAAAPEPTEAAPLELPASIMPSMTQGWLPLLLAFVGFGLLLSFTPCVLPMLPIVAGMLTRGGARMSPARGFALATIYTLAMASAYAVLGVAAAWSGQNLQSALQTPAALATMAAIYLALALSSFGVFGLQVPARFADLLATRLRSGAGPLLGAAALGFSSALIVGPCVTPPLAAALLYVAQTGDTTRGAAALFALGLGMGFPLILVGTFGAGILPRSGPWLATVRKLFGFAFLGVAILLLGRLLPAMLTLLLWAGLAVGLAAFIGAFDRVHRLSGAPARFGKAFGLALFVYGAALILGAAGGSDDPLRPLGVFGVQTSSAGSIEAPTVSSVAALDAAIADRRQRGKPIMIDFSADWCTACKTMQREVFDAPAVRQRLAGVTMIRVDITANDGDAAALMKRFGVVGPPTVLFLNADTGGEITAARTIGEVSAETFIKALRNAGAPS